MPPSLPFPLTPGIRRVKLVRAINELDSLILGYSAQGIDVSGLCKAIIDLTTWANQVTEHEKSWR